MSFKDAMDTRMAEINLKAIDLARRSGVSRQYISMIESGGIREPSFEMGRKIAKGLGLTMDELAAMAYDKTEH